jgi:DNA-binding CsgD family transcriptional regulator
MYAETEIQGEDVIGRPGQALSFAELRVLVGLADGETPNAIGEALGVDKFGIRNLESSIKAKLGAKTHPHMIARGFTLGVLMPRALCLLLSLLCATEHEDDSNRNNTRRSSRTAPASRLTRASTGRSASGTRGDHDSALLAQYFQLPAAVAGLYFANSLNS